MNDLNNQQKKHVNIGLDIGTTSVGWAIIDNDYNVIDYGVRLFEDACEKNKDTRRLRLQRRRWRRIRYRKKKFRNLILKYKSLFSFDENEIKQIVKLNLHPWDIKVKGINSEIEKKELVYILHHYLSHRGRIYDKEDDDGNNVEDKKQKTNLFPSEQQKSFFDRNGFLPSNFNVDFKIEDWEDEIKKIFKNQNYLLNNEKFRDDYLRLFRAHRDFSIGPGSYNSPTKWGLFVKKYDRKTKEMSVVDRRDGKEWAIDLPSLNRGICKWNNGEKGCIKQPRANNKTASAIICNILNALQNVRLSGKENTWRIKKEQKKQFLLSLFSKQKINQKKELEKILNFDEEAKSQINFWNNIDVSNIIISLELLNIKALDFVNQIDNCVNDENNIVNQINSLVELKNSVKNYNEFIDIHRLNNKGKKVDDNRKIELLNRLKINLGNPNDICNTNIYDKFRKIKSDTYNKFGVKALNYFICKLFNDEKGNNLKYYFESFENYFEPELCDDLYINLNKIVNSDQFPNSVTVRRSIRQTIRVLNAIFKKIKSKGWFINSIAIENCREKNNLFKKNELSKLAKQYEQMNENFKKKYKTEDKKVLKMLRIASLHDWCDPYEPEKNIEPKGDIKKWAKTYTLDHIIPKSYFTFPDSSSSNLVVTSTKNNYSKGERTPYLFFKNNRRRWEEIKKRFQPKLPKINNNEKCKLLDDVKISKFCFEDDNPKKSNKLYEMCHCKRLLQDTSYISQYIYEIIYAFTSNNSNYKYFNSKKSILKVPSLATNYVREGFLKEEEFQKWKWKKLSQTVKIVFKKKGLRFWHKLHAIDAIIIAMIGCSDKLTSIFNDYKNNCKYQNLTINRIFGYENIEKIAKYIKNYNPKYSRMLSKKFNIGFYNELPKPKVKEISQDKMVLKKKIDIFEDIKSNKNKKTNDYTKFFLTPKKTEKGKLFNSLTNGFLNGESINQLKEIISDPNFNAKKTSPFLEFMYYKRNINANHRELSQTTLKIFSQIKKMNKNMDKNKFYELIRNELCKKYELRNLINDIDDDLEFRNIISTIIENHIKKIDDDIEICKKVDKDKYSKAKTLSDIMFDNNISTYDELKLKFSDNEWKLRCKKELNNFCKKIKCNIQQLTQNFTIDDDIIELTKKVLDFSNICKKFDEIKEKSEPKYFYLNSLNKKNQKIKIRKIYFKEIKYGKNAKKKYFNARFIHPRTKGVFEEINSIGFDLYYENDNESPIALVPLNFFTVKFNVNKNDHFEFIRKKEYYKQLEENKNYDYDKKYSRITIYRGQTFYTIDDNGDKSIFYLAGYRSADKKVELHPLQYNDRLLYSLYKKGDEKTKDEELNNIKKSEIRDRFTKEFKLKDNFFDCKNPSRNLININTFLRKYRIYHCDILGDKKR